MQRGSNKKKSWDAMGGNPSKKEQLQMDVVKCLLKAGLPAWIPNIDVYECALEVAAIAAFEDESDELFFAAAVKKHHFTLQQLACLTLEELVSPLLFNLSYGDAKRVVTILPWIKLFHTHLFTAQDVEKTRKQLIVEDVDEEKEESRVEYYISNEHGCVICRLDGCLYFRSDYPSSIKTTHTSLRSPSGEDVTVQGTGYKKSSFRDTQNIGKDLQWQSKLF
jgi:hypothetical protein